MPEPKLSASWPEGAVEARGSNGCAGCPRLGLPARAKLPWLAARQPEPAGKNTKPILKLVIRLGKLELRGLKLHLPEAISNEFAVLNFAGAGARTRVL